MLDPDALARRLRRDAGLLVDVFAAERRALCREREALEEGQRAAAALRLLDAERTSDVRGREQLIEEQRAAFSAVRSALGELDERGRSFRTALSAAAPGTAAARAETALRHVDTLWDRMEKLNTSALQSQLPPSAARSLQEDDQGRAATSASEEGGLPREVGELVPIEHRAAAFATF